MNDFDYDCYLKKNIARSASKCVRGSKSKKCTLLTDNLTQKQWKERCGDVVSYKMNEPLKWKEFCELPSDLKEEYLNGLVENYAAGAGKIAGMFGVSGSSLFRLIRNDGLKVTFPKGRCPADKQWLFEQFLEVNGTDEACIAANTEEANEENCEPRNIRDADSLVETEEKEDFRAYKAGGTKMTDFSVCFDGDVNIEMIMNSIRFMLGEAGKARVNISCVLY